MLLISSRKPILWLQCHTRCCTWLPIGIPHSHCPPKIKLFSQFQPWSLWIFPPFCTPPKVFPNGHSIRTSHLSCFPTPLQPYLLPIINSHHGACPLLANLHPHFSNIANSTLSDFASIPPFFTLLPAACLPFYKAWFRLILIPTSQERDLCNFCNLAATPRRILNDYIELPSNLLELNPRLSKFYLIRNF